MAGDSVRSSPFLGGKGGGWGGWGELHVYETAPMHTGHNGDVDGDFQG